MNTSMMEFTLQIFYISKLYFIKKYFFINLLTNNCLYSNFKKCTNRNYMK